MSNNKQSSIEWYAEKEHEIAREFVLANINHREYFDKKRELLEQAKEMHKEELKKCAETFEVCYYDGIHNGTTFNEYYNETFNN